MASLVAFADATYSASTVEVATVDCFLDDQETVLPSMSNANPLTDHLESGSCPQLASLQPTRLILPSFWLPNMSCKSAVPFK